MARKLELKTVTIENPLTGQPAPFDYGEVIMQMLRLGGSANRGMTIDEVERAMEALDPVKRALAAGEDSVTLSEEQYKTLKGKLDEFQFSFACIEIAEFGRMIKNAPEIGTQEAHFLPELKRA